jgi:adenosylcobinamide kinase/adenosylcobinamide-phosphate guanylyltransferase
MGRLIFVTGGTRSGKSAFAEEVVTALGSDVTYIATARAGDSEMAERIALHRQRRPQSWRTVEEPEEVRGAIEFWGERSEVILLDCLTIYISNLLLAGEKGGADNDSTGGGEPDRDIVSDVRQIAAAAKTVKAHVVVVSNEVGLSLVSPYPLGRQYQEIVGRANQVLARDAEETYMVVAGIPLDLKEMGRQVRKRFREEKVRRD